MTRDSVYYFDVSVRDENQKSSTQCDAWTTGPNTNNPYAFDPEPEDGIFQYSESDELAEKYGEMQSAHEPRTPFVISVRNNRSFQLTTPFYEFVTFHNRCEMMNQSQATLVSVSRKNAQTHLQIRGNRIRLIGEDGRQHHFVMDSPSALQLARLIVWRQNLPENNPHKACLAVYDQLVINLEKSLKNSLIRLFFVYLWFGVMFGFFIYFSDVISLSCFALALSWGIIVVAVNFKMISFWSHWMYGIFLLCPLSFSIFPCLLLTQTMFSFLSVVTFLLINTIVISLCLVVNLRQARQMIRKFQEENHRVSI
jgi:hypothetical protein